MKREDFINITEKHFKMCRDLIKRDGKCTGLLCKSCPFSSNNNRWDNGCAQSCYSAGNSRYKSDYKLVNSAREFIEKFKEEKMLEGRFRCVESEYEQFMKAGDIYEFVDGQTTMEDGTLSYRYKNLKDFYVNNMGIKIEEVKEFTKDDLKDGMVIMDEDDNLGVYLSIGVLSISENDSINIHKNNINDYWFENKVNSVYVIPKSGVSACLSSIRRSISDGSVKPIYKREELSPQQIELQKLESELKDITDRISKLKEEM